MIDSAATRTIAALYRPIEQGRWALRVGGVGFARGYWSGPALVDIIVLMRDGENWMSITPLEMESQQIGIEAATGHVVIMGLGMGWAAAACAMKLEVRAVTVVERDADVIAMHRELGLFARLPDGAGGKVRIVEGDALAWRAEESVDLLMPDIWLPLISDGRIEEVRRMHANVGARQVYFWGQELEIARHAIVAGRTKLDEADISATAEAVGLPLVGPGGKDHASRLRAAAEQWMNDHWLSIERPEPLHAGAAFQAPPGQLGSAPTL